MANARVKGIWSRIKQRCYDSNCSDYKNYGERGIVLQASWINDSEAFTVYVASLPNYDRVFADDLTLDRIDNDKGYVEGNLRWATRAEQNKNRRARNDSGKWKKTTESFKDYLLL